MKTVRLKIKRRENENAPSYWEEFEIPYRPAMNVISCLMAIQKNPINAQGQPTTPVAFESNCLEEVCGSCSMVINGKARQACSALIDTLKQPIVLEPMDKFKVIRDLYIDRQAFFDALRKVKAWVDIDGTHELGQGPRYSRQVQELRYDISRCMTCGVCGQVCPNYNSNTNFVGPHVAPQVVSFNLHPNGAFNKEERLEALMDEGGIFECGNSQNCVTSCPKEIPLRQSIAKVKSDVTWSGIKSLFNK